MSKTSIPSPPPNAEAARTLEALKEFAEVSGGVRGNRMDKRPTVRELLAAGVITEAQARALSG